MIDTLTADDGRYEEMFDVRNEAATMGTLVDFDTNEAFRTLRDKAPVQKGSLHELLNVHDDHPHYTTSRTAYTALSFESCNRAFRDNATFSSHLYGERPSIQAMGKTIIQMVGEEHQRYRSIIQPIFAKPQAFTWWRSRWIDEIVARLVDNLHGMEKADLNIQFCARLPVHTVTRGAGLDGEDSLLFRKALRAMIGVYRSTPQEQREGHETVERLLFDLIDKRRTTPGDDVISGLLKAELPLPDGTVRPLNDQEIMANCRLIILAGGGTTWRQLGITLWGLLSNPKQFDAVKADRKLLDAAIDESVRWNPTASVFSRLVTADTDMEGTLVPAGSILDICLAAANRDPKRWADADSFDLHRPRQSHLGFSVGPHQCLGMHVAKAEMIVAINALIDNFPNMKLDLDEPTPEIVGGLEQRGMSTVPVVLA